MDEITLGAVTAVWHRDFDVARRWFDAIAQEYQALLESDGHNDWPLFCRNLADRAARDLIGADAVEGLAAFLEKYSPAPMDVVARLADPAIRDDLVSLYAQAVEQHGG